MVCSYLDYPVLDSKGHHDTDNAIVDNGVLTNMNYKVPVCEKCGNTLKGRVPNEARVVCYFCSNPPLPEEEETLKYKDIPNGTTRLL